MESQLRAVWGDAAVRREDDHTILLRPVIGLVGHERHAELSYYVRQWLGHAWSAC